jgi:hypothetical protein
MLAGDNCSGRHILCNAKTIEDLKGIFHSDPEIMGGTPVFVGTRDRRPQPEFPTKQYQISNCSGGT